MDGGVIMITYTKEVDKIYMVTTTKTEVDVQAMKDELASLKAMQEPSDEELIEAGRMNHPYYTDTGRVGMLEAKIAEIELAVKEPVAIEK